MIWTTPQGDVWHRIHAARKRDEAARKREPTEAEARRAEALTQHAELVASDKRVRRKQHKG